MRAWPLALALLWPIAAAAQSAPRSAPPGVAPAEPTVVTPGGSAIIATPLPPPPGAAGTRVAPMGPGSLPASGAAAAGSSGGASVPGQVGAGGSVAPAVTQAPPPGEGLAVAPPGTAPAAVAPAPAGAGTTLPVAAAAGAVPQGTSAGGGAAAAAGTAAPPADQGTALPATWLPRTAARLQVLNKQTASTREILVPVGGAAKVGPLTVTVRACVVRPPGMPADAAAFLDIAPTKPGPALYQGWSLKNEPFLSMFQQPTYNIRVLGCGA